MQLELHRVERPQTPERLRHSVLLPHIRGRKSITVHLPALTGAKLALGAAKAKVVKRAKPDGASIADALA